ncbi:MAG TPA: hypothetical protein VG346_01385 [Acidimicrobiales bacterium]|jgi:hypothetical protein|nr:hypothetical protein [Acidimicrobiales bacterium]
MAFRWPTIAEVGAAVALCLAESDEASARRLAFRFVEQFDKAAEADRRRMVEVAPLPTGDLRYDALLASVVEYCCVHHDMRPPTWVNEPSRFLEEWWFVSGIRSLHANAVVHSPISFKRRGVFITEDSLTYA